jgi:hypothetical protein
MAKEMHNGKPVVTDTSAWLVSMPVPFSKGAGKAFEIYFSPSGKAVTLCNDGRSKVDVYIRHRDGILRAYQLAPFDYWCAAEKRYIPVEDLWEKLKRWNTVLAAAREVC